MGPLPTYNADRMASICLWSVVALNIDYSAAAAGFEQISYRIDSIPSSSSPLSSAGSSSSAESLAAATTWKAKS